MRLGVRSYGMSSVTSGSARPSAAAADNDDRPQGNGATGLERGNARACAYTFTLDCCPTRSVVTQSLAHRRVYHRAGNFDQLDRSESWERRLAEDWSKLPPELATNVAVDGRDPTLPAIKLSAVDETLGTFNEKVPLQHRRAWPSSQFALALEDSHWRSNRLASGATLRSEDVGNDVGAHAVAVHARSQ